MRVLGLLDRPCLRGSDAADREKGEASKAREYLPTDKQYLVTRGVPCLRRATSLAYTDADEDAERMVSVGEGVGADGGDDWVETHAGRVPGSDSAANAGDIDDIPDVDDEDDGPHHSSSARGITSAMGGLSVSGAGTRGGGGQGAPAKVADIPDMDEIPDMEEDLEVIEDDAAVVTNPARGVADPRCVSSFPALCWLLLTLLASFSARSSQPAETCSKYGPTMS